MELRHLKFIKEVAEKKSLSKATHSLFLSQSALSHQLKEIETHFGTPIFHRVNRQLILTEAGKVLLEASQKVLSDLDQMERTIQGFASGDSGVIRLATQCYTCYHWLPSILIDFKKEFPNVEVEVILNSNSGIEDLVLQGDIDLAILSENSIRPKLKYHELFRDEQFALVNADHPWSTRKYVEAVDFADQNVLIHSYPVESVSLFTQLLIPNGITPKRITQVQVTDAVVELVNAGMGIKVVARWVIEPYLKTHDLKLVRVTRKGMSRTWYAVHLIQDNPPPFLQNFANHLSNHIGDLCCSH